LLERIAATLDLPTAALHDLSPVAGDQTHCPDAPNEASHHQCLELVRAFCRIGDPDERHRLLILVQNASRAA
jgi:hypothetical protein